MYWFILIIVVCFIFYFIYSLNSRVVISDEELLENLWDIAEVDKENILKRSPLLGDVFGRNLLEEEMELVNLMEIDIIRLNEKYKHDLLKRKEIVSDWVEYSSAVLEIKNAQEMLSVDYEDGAFDRHSESVKKPYIVIEEVIKRVISELGDESKIKEFYEKLKKMKKF